MLDYALERHAEALAVTNAGAGDLTGHGGKNVAEEILDKQLPLVVMRHTRNRIRAQQMSAHIDAERAPARERDGRDIGKGCAPFSADRFGFAKNAVVHVCGAL